MNAAVHEFWSQPPLRRTYNLALMPYVSTACVSLNAFTQHRLDGSLNTEPRAEDENQTLLNATCCLGES